MDVTAKLRYLRMSPRKVRRVVDLIRGMDVRQAQAQLQFLKPWAARPVLKLLNSAIANAENNFKLDPEGLYVKRIVADQGPTLKRFQPKAFGRADVIRKRTTHVIVVLGEKPGQAAGKSRGKPKAASVPPILPKETIKEAPVVKVPKAKRPPKRGRLSRVKELGTKIIHRRGTE